MGTRFLATREAPVHPALKQCLVDAGECDTQLILRAFRNTARVLRDSVAAEVAQPESRPGAQFSDVAEQVPGRPGARVFESGDL